MADCLVCGDACTGTFCQSCEKRPDRDEIAQANALQAAYEEWCAEDERDDAVNADHD